MLNCLLTQTSALACPDFSLPFILQTDVITVGLGAVLTKNPAGRSAGAPGFPEGPTPRRERRSRPTVRGMGDASSYGMSDLTG